MRTIYTLTLLLTGIGLVMIYSTSAIHAWELYEDQYFFFRRQLAWACLGVCAMLAGSFIKLEYFAKHARSIFLFSVILLVLVLFPSIGVRAGGARRWLNIAGMSFQPAELAKIGVILYSAVLLSEKRNITGGSSLTRAVLPILAAAGLVCGLIIAQPDFGTAVLLGCIVFAMMFLSGVKAKYLLGISSAAVPVLLYLVVSAPYRLRRILIFLNPWDDPGDSGYQVIQSFLALGSGGWMGRGLGRSVQKLYYLPESYTDFIFSIIGEETGFLGAAFILFLFGALTVYGFRASARAESKFARIVGFGVVSMISIQCVIHIGVVTGCLPPKGLPLPFISFGGSSLVVQMFGSGLLANIARRGRREGL